VVDGVVYLRLSPDDQADRPESPVAESPVPEEHLT
jgi:hypothetical protein